MLCYVMSCHVMLCYVIAISLNSFTESIKWFKNAIISYTELNSTHLQEFPKQGLGGGAYWGTFIPPEQI